ncbi:MULTISPECIES: nickel-binding protein [unclassified Ensifer]|uniref:nickel-binding protein n=1 Tax=unclassified Ensifer TaxID=2633371 RepID=UPI00070B8F3B|nr:MULTISPECIES: nickel-binding protein [unclassified Ensifer]KQW50469.1 cyclase [Ensifer sp. Root1252]KRC74693.1 cyclase [Ensifer sp. Root231]KRC94779.1 cyclase [Ensifer sp. Root258]
MPIFMDRHDLAGASAADVAEAHLKDLSIQDQYGVKFLTYWFDHRRGTTFCLIDAPDAETAQCVHREAHGFVAGEVVEVALSAVEAFLGRIQDPEAAGLSAKEMDAGHRAILFTDIVGSTEMTSRLGDRMATELVRAHDALVRGCLSQTDGREVKHTGDGIMAAFPSTAFAVDCAREIQREFQRYNAGNGEPIHIRIGLDCGEPVEDSNDLFGTTVQLAARLCAAARSDQILISENIFREYNNAAVFTHGMRHHLKGFAKPVLAYQCEWLNA